MKVRELITALEQFNPNQEVILDNGEEFREVGNISNTSTGEPPAVVIVVV
jgi:hypothetical protein